MYLRSTASLASTVPAFTVSPCRSHCMPCLIHIILTMGHTYEWKKDHEHFSMFMCVHKEYILCLSVCIIPFFSPYVWGLTKHWLFVSDSRAHSSRARAKYFYGGKIAVWLGTIKVLTYVYLITSKHHTW